MSGLSIAYQKAMNEIDDMIDAEIKIALVNRYVKYSAYEVDQFDTPINNLNEVPVKGKIRFVSEDGEWESNPRYGFESPTWLKIAVIANQMIIDTEDWHNVYLEDIDIFENQDGVMVAKLLMGS